MRAVSSERAAKRSGVERKEKKIGWWVPWMEKKEREKTAVSGYEKEISFGGVEAEEEEEKKDRKGAVRKRREGWKCRLERSRGLGMGRSKPRDVLYSVSCRNAPY